MVHVPVLQKEVLDILAPKPNENFIDCTFGEGGHTLLLLEKNGPRGRILALDQDSEQINQFRSPSPDFKERVILVAADFTKLKEIVERYNFEPVHGILLDLGMSSWHLERSGRGFSFQKEEPLDMRYNQASERLTAKEIVNQWPLKEIERILREYGEERFARRIAREIVAQRKKELLQTTFDLREVIRRATPSWYHHRKIHFATRTFQALRIAVNQELEKLEKVLPQALDVLAKEGRLVVISFHSLEDRLVKNFFKKAKDQGRAKILFKKPLTPKREEIKLNPRSRSAKLRAIQKI